MQLRLHLIDTAPPVWRRIEIEGAQSLAVLGVAINRALAWPSGQVAPFFAISKDAELAYVRPLEGPLEPRTSVAAALPAPGMRLQQGENAATEWTLEILFEAVRPRQAGARYPRAIDGESHPPPWECGNADEYNEMLDSVDDPRTAGYSDAVAVLGDGFN